jgi:hypothetical protein
LAARRPRPATPVESAEAPEVTPEPSHVTTLEQPLSTPVAAPAPRRSARIVAAPEHARDAARIERERLLARFLGSQGRAMISRAADECVRAGIEFPADQASQLQLLEHVDEALARSAIATLGRILALEPPAKRPILEQRLRRLEDTAEEEATRTAAAELRRALRG